MSFICWPVIINEFPQSVAITLTAIANKYLKKWLGINRPASTEILYLPEAGLNLKNPVTFLKTCRFTNITYSLTPATQRYDSSPNLDFTKL